jgi:anhydro-N-acetylmuramic acid kinase
MERICRSLAKKTRLALGLMSGSSTDGVDVALVRIRPEPERFHARVVAFRCDPYPAPLRRRLIRAAEGEVGLGEAAELDVLLGAVFAERALALLARLGIASSRVDVIGSHGHTLLHRPPQPRRPAFSIQAGSGDVIADRTGIPTVTGFRGRDLVAGGQGAPLVPYVDHLLFRRPGRVRALQNIGGIANVTVVADTADRTVAFDTGPGNAMIDHAVALATGGRRRYDRDGRMAARGRIDRAVLERLHAHPFFARPVPRSTSRETFGAALTERLARGRTSARDLVATLTRFTAESIHRSYREHVPARLSPAEILVSGGGAHNRTIMAHLAELFRPVPVRPLHRFGFDPDSKEAAAFAILGHETLAGRPGNLPSATGAARPVVLGRLSLP